MKRSVSFFTLAAVVAATLALSSAALADPSPGDSPSDGGNPSCFGAFARSEPDRPGPGAFVGNAATTLSEPGTPGSKTDEVASNMGPVQHVRQGLCPANYPLQQDGG